MVKVEATSGLTPAPIAAREALVREIRFFRALHWRREDQCVRVSEEARVACAEAREAEEELIFAQDRGDYAEDQLTLLTECAQDSMDALRQEKLQLTSELEQHLRMTGANLSNPICQRCGPLREETRKAEQQVAELSGLWLRGRDRETHRSAERRRWAAVAESASLRQLRDELGERRARVSHSVSHLRVLQELCKLFGAGGAGLAWQAELPQRARDAVAGLAEKRFPGPGGINEQFSSTREDGTASFPSAGELLAPLLRRCEEMLRPHAASSDGSDNIGDTAFGSERLLVAGETTPRDEGSNRNTRGPGDAGLAALDYGGPLALLLAHLDGGLFPGALQVVPSVPTASAPSALKPPERAGGPDENKWLLPSSAPSSRQRLDSSTDPQAADSTSTPSAAPSSTSWSGRSWRRSGGLEVRLQRLVEELADRNESYRNELKEATVWRDRTVDVAGRNACADAELAKEEEAWRQHRQRMADEAAELRAEVARLETDLPTLRRDTRDIRLQLTRERQKGVAQRDELTEQRAASQRLANKLQASGAPLPSLPPRSSMVDPAARAEQIQRLKRELGEAYCQLAELDDTQAQIDFAALQVRLEEAQSENSKLKMQSESGVVGVSAENRGGREASSSVPIAEDQRASQTRQLERGPEVRQVELIGRLARNRTEIAELRTRLQKEERRGEAPTTEISGSGTASVPVLQGGGAATIHAGSAAGSTSGSGAVPIRYGSQPATVVHGFASSHGPAAPTSRPMSTGALASSLVLPATTPTPPLRMRRVASKEGNGGAVLDAAGGLNWGSFPATRSVSPEVLLPGGAGARDNSSIESTAVRTSLLGGQPGALGAALASGSYRR